MLLGLCAAHLFLEHLARHTRPVPLALDVLGATRRLLDACDKLLAGVPGAGALVWARADPRRGRGRFGRRGFARVSPLRLRLLLLLRGQLGLLRLLQGLAHRRADNRIHRWFSIESRGARGRNEAHCGFGRRRRWGRLDVRGWRAQAIHKPHWRCVAVRRRTVAAACGRRS